MKYKLSQYCIKIGKIDDYIIIYNSVTGGISKLEETVYNFISQNQFFDDNIPYFDLLRKEHYIVPSSMNEFRNLRHKEIMVQSNTTKLDCLTFVIAPTTACNYRCSYCFEHEQHVTDKPDDSIITSIVEFIINQCETVGKIKKVCITWFGGEPLLCFNEIVLFGRILKGKLSAKNIALDSRIITNGVFLSKENVQILKDNCNLTSAQITIDGLCDNYCKKKQCTPNDYYKVIENISTNYLDIDICVRLNVDHSNVNDMYALADLFYGKMRLNDKLKLYFAMLRDYTNGELKNIPFFTLVEYQKEKRKFYNYLIERGYIKKSDSNIVTAIPFHKPIYCGLSRIHNFAIGPKGELYKCEHHFGQKDKIIGDVKTGLYYNDYYFNHIMGVNDEMCQNCGLYPICQTNCPEIHNLVQRKNGKCLRYDVVLKSITNLVNQYCGK